MERKGWILVKLLVVITGVLIFVYLITPKLQKNVYKVRDLTTQTNLEYIRVAILEYCKDNESQPNSLKKLIPKYLNEIPKEFLSSAKGSNIVVNTKKESDYSSLRGPQLKGWIYGSYEVEADIDEKFSYKALPMSTTFSDKSGDTSSW
ncbi:MAG: hypothetical protein P9M06_04000 [Candidatus Saelkia tenebricola]|nr:hypothetical protein [Candidatus Saelkia tenebricola]